MLLLLVESLSRVNARVQLPRTVAVLRDLYNSTFLNGEQLSSSQYPTHTLSSGLVKVGDNTFPNLLTLLTGLFAGERDGSGAETGR